MIVAFLKWVFLYFLKLERTRRKGASVVRTALVPVTPKETAEVCLGDSCRPPSLHQFSLHAAPSLVSTGKRLAVFTMLRGLWVGNLILYLSFWNLAVPMSHLGIWLKYRFCLWRRPGWGLRFSISAAAEGCGAAGLRTKLGMQGLQPPN